MSVKIIGEAPKGPSDTKGWISCPDHKKPEFEKRWYEEEALKRYWCQDRDGNAFLIQNPCCWQVVENPDGTLTRIRPAPEPTFLPKPIVGARNFSNLQDICSF